MRRFLYLNNDSIYSYISQMNDGLPIKVTNTNSLLEENGKEIKSSVDGELDVDLKVFGKGLNADLSTDIGDVISTSTSNQQANSIEKKIYDEAFDKLEKHLRDSSLIKNDELVIGDFLQVKDEMFIVDLEYYKNIFSNNTVLEFAKNSEIEERLKELSQNIEITGNGKAEYEKEKLKKEIKKHVDLEYERIKKIINAIFNIVPYNKFGIMGDYLIVLDDEYFRDKTKVVAYKYGGKMTMLGYLTNIVSNDEIQDDSNIFRTFPTMVNTFMLSFFNKTEIKIIHPIAIYY